jgi:hypothetical protein
LIVWRIFEKFEEQFQCVMQPVLCLYRFLKFELSTRWWTGFSVFKYAKIPVALRKRRKVEALFSELKNLIGLRRLRLRRIKFVREQFLPGCHGPEPETTGAVPQQESATSDGNRVRNRLPQEKHEPEETPLRENASSNRVFQHQRDLSTMIPKGLAFASNALTASSYWTNFNLRFANGRFSADLA